jgi:hypothetical protein
MLHVHRLNTAVEEELKIYAAAVFFPVAVTGWFEAFKAADLFAR